MISFECDGDFSKLIGSLDKLKNFKIDNILTKYANEGVNALRSATPVQTGKTANSWSYKIERTGSGASIFWTNSNINNGVNIAVILQYGHGTGTGGYVQGRDYINPAMRPVFDKIADSAWREVVSL